MAGPRMGRMRLPRETLKELLDRVRDGVFENAIADSIRLGKAQVGATDGSILVEFQAREGALPDPPKGPAIVEAPKPPPITGAEFLAKIHEAIPDAFAELTSPLPGDELGGKDPPPEPREIAPPTPSPEPLHLPLDRPRVAVVLGTYNRFGLLARAIESVRRAAAPVGGCHFIVVDGGSTDGSRQWLSTQPDVVLVGQLLPLTGAVHAFNIGFGYAVSGKYEFVLHFNDDAEILDGNGLVRALDVLDRQHGVGAVAFGFDLRGKFGVEHIHDKPYSNFGVIRTSAGMAVARAQGDPTGRAWWNPIYRTYGADTELGCWLHKLGYEVAAMPDVRVRDYNCQDALRKGNEKFGADSALFWRRWPTADTLKPDLSRGE